MSLSTAASDSMFIYSFSSIKFSHERPIQFPHACIQLIPFFRQVHERVPHVFLDVVLQLQRITLSRASGAIGLSVITGTSWPFTICHPHSCGTKPQSIPSFCVLIISKWTRNEWKYVAPYDGRNSAGSTSLEVMLASTHLEWRKVA